MTQQEKVLCELMNENKIKEYDTINLDCIGFYLKYGTNIIRHNEIPTLTTNCDVAVVVRRNNG